MGSGMNVEQAKEYAETMTYRQALSNCWYAKGIAYRKATIIKLRELIDIADKLDKGEQLDKHKVSLELKNQWLKRCYESVSEENRKLKAERKTGKWIPIRETFNGISGEETYITGMRCSECGRLFDVRAYNFCPNCGADVRPKLAGKHADQIIIDEAMAETKGECDENRD